MPGKKTAVIVIIALFTGGYVLAETNRPPADSQPLSLNITGREYPRIDS